MGSSSHKSTQITYVESGIKEKMRNPKIGLLLLYNKLYDDATPEYRDGFSTFVDEIEEHFKQRNVDVVRSDVARVAREFYTAARLFQKRDVDCIVALHLSYSPSLEAINALEKTHLPILLLDTSVDSSFGLDANLDRMMYDHGIIGATDLASLLRRRKIPFEIVAGYYRESNIMDQTASIVRGAYAAQCIRQTKVLCIGGPFRGMGDFSVDSRLLKSRLGITVHQITAEDLTRDVKMVSEKEIDNEIASDKTRFKCDLEDDVHRHSVRVGLGLRRRLKKGGYSAFSMNFLAFEKPNGPVSTVPFLEASKAMARGIGYAGEGDVLAASLVGALARAVGTTTFTEIFCPDWEGNSLWLSHMGEINPDVASDTPHLVEKTWWPWTNARKPAVLFCALKSGPATLVNISPGPDETFQLIAAPVEALGDGTHPSMQDSVRGWIRTRSKVADFLESYSRNGGTHHSALVMGDRTESIEALAKFLGIDYSLIS